jgi:hypothetical protein
MTASSAGRFGLPAGRQPLGLRERSDDARLRRVLSGRRTPSCNRPPGEHDERIAGLPERGAMRSAGLTGLGALLSIAAAGPPVEAFPIAAVPRRVPGGAGRGRARR